MLKFGSVVCPLLIFLLIFIDICQETELVSINHVIMPFQEIFRFSQIFLTSSKGLCAYT